MDSKLEALKNRRMKGVTLEIKVKPSDELAPGAPEEEEKEAPEGSKEDLAEDIAEGEAPDMQAAIKQHEKDDEAQDEATFKKMLEGTSFAKRFGKKVG